MSIDGEYAPSTWGWVADQVERYEASGGTDAATLLDTGIPIIVTTMRGHKTGKVRKVPLMRVEHDGEYALIASKGGAPSHPGWYHNLMAHPETAIEIGTQTVEVLATEIVGAERDALFEAQKAEVPQFAEYESRTARTIPLVALTRR